MSKNNNSFYLFLFFLSVVAGGLPAQKYDYNWVLGDGFNGNGFNIVNFGTKPANITSNDTNMFFLTNIISASDSMGNLIFYSNGLDIRNRNDKKMKGSELFNYSDIPEYRKELEKTYHCDNIKFRSLFIPLPNNKNQYSIFHVAFQIDSNSLYSETNSLMINLYFTIIDMDNDDGMGEVIKKNILLRQNTDGVALTKHANGKDWWLVTSDYLTNKYFVYLIDSTGITAPQVFILGPSISYNSNTWKNSNGLSYIGFSPNGKLLVRWKSLIGLFVLDFDRTNGHLTFKYFNDLYGQYRLAFSPDSKYLFLRKAMDNRIIQYNITNKEIHTGPYLYYVDYCLAPSGKLYISGGPIVSSPTYWNFLHYLNRPNLPGIHSDLHFEAIKLPKQYSFGLPSYPNYRLKAIQGYSQTDKKNCNEYIFLFESSNSIIDEKYTKIKLTREDNEILQKFLAPMIKVKKYNNRKEYFDEIFIHSLKQE